MILFFMQGATHNPYAPQVLSPLYHDLRFQIETLTVSLTKQKARVLDLEATIVKLSQKPLNCDTATQTKPKCISKSCATESISGPEKYSQTFIPKIKSIGSQTTPEVKTVKVVVPVVPKPPVAAKASREVLSPKPQLTVKEPKTSDDDILKEQQELGDKKILEAIIIVDQALKEGRSQNAIQILREFKGTEFSASPEYKVFLRDALLINIISSKLTDKVNKNDIKQAYECDPIHPYIIYMRACIETGDKAKVFFDKESQRQAQNFSIVKDHCLFWLYLGKWTHENVTLCPFSMAQAELMSKIFSDEGCLPYHRIFAGLNFLLLNLHGANINQKNIVIAQLMKWTNNNHLADYQQKDALISTLKGIECIIHSDDSIMSLGYKKYYEKLPIECLPRAKQYFENREYAKVFELYAHVLLAHQYYNQPIEADVLKQWENLHQEAKDNLLALELIAEIKTK